MSASSTPRWRRRLARILGVLLALAVVAYFGIGAFTVSRLTQTVRRPIASNPAADGLRYQDVTFPSADGEVNLSGWLFKAEADQGRLVILVHGYNSQRDDPNTGIYPLAQGLLEQQFSVLMFDLRGYGLSEGERFSLAYYEQHDVRGAVAFAQSQGYAHIGVVGFSMGGASTLLAAADEPAIKAVVSDSTYASLSDVLAREIPKRSGLPTFFTPGVELMALAMYGIDIDAVNPAAAAAAYAPRPLLVVHGTADTFIPPDSAEQIWTSRYGPGEPDPATLALVPTAEHVQAFKVDPERYLALVGGFFNTHLR